MVWCQVPEHEQCLPGVRCKSPALPRYVPRIHDPTDQRVAFVKTRTGAVAGTRLVQRYGWNLGQKVPISSEIHPKADGSLAWEFDLVGILDAADPTVRGNTGVVLINSTYFDEARQSNKGRTGWYIERITDATQAKAISAAIDALFLNSPRTKPEPSPKRRLRLPSPSRLAISERSSYAFWPPYSSPFCS